MQECQELDMPPPIQGKHKLQSQQRLYESTHDFLSTRTWKVVGDDSGIGGATWMELFALFDRCSFRHREAHHPRETAKARKAAKAGNGKKALVNKNAKQVAQVAASLHQELMNFKKIIRFIGGTTSTSSNKSSSRWKIGST